MASATHLPARGRGRLRVVDREQRAMASVAVPVIAMPRAALARGHPRDAKAPRVVRGGPIGHRVLRRGRVAARAVEEATSTSTSPSPASSSPTDCLPDADDALPDAVVEFLRRDGRHASFSSVKVGSIEVDEVNGGRSLREYMSLPASQYSTLDGEKVERIGDDTFVCTLGSFDFLGFKLQPVLTARVDVRPDGRGCVIRVVSAEIHGSRVVEGINGMFEIDSVNRVGWNERCNPGTGQCEIASETKVTVYLLVPKWFPFTVKATERTGNFVVAQVVNQVVPRFLLQLKTDYETWANGDDSREATGSDLFAVDLEEK